MSVVPEAKPVKTGLNAIQSPVLTGSFEDSDRNGSGAHWQRELAGAIRTVPELLDELSLKSSDFAEIAPEDSPGFAVFVPRSFLRRMNRCAPADPLLLQVLPQSAESRHVAGFVADAVGDQNARQAPGLLQKYRGRALLIAAGSCAVHCRYCFRRDYPYNAEPRRLVDWEPALHQLSGDSSISEVLLSGGDPLILPDGRLAELVQRLDAIPHIQRIRFHTRLPIVLPARVNDELLHLLHSLRSQPVIVVHSNHAQEIQLDCSEALARLVRGGVPVLNQAVLLRGINDSTAAQVDLNQSLVDLGVFPYYLHQLDRVQGTSHFEVPEADGIRIMQEMRQQLPGYAVPTYVQEIAGQPGKTPLEMR